MLLLLMMMNHIRSGMFCFSSMMLMVCIIVRIVDGFFLFLWFWRLLTNFLSLCLSLSSLYFEAYRKRGGGGIKNTKLPLQLTHPPPAPNVRKNRANAHTWC